MDPIRMDLLKDISDIGPSRRNPFDTIFPFLRRALFPPPSSNRNPNRFDTALADSLVNPKSYTTVLDLGCGEWMLFEKLLQLHQEGDQGHLTAPCQYIGIDTVPDIDSRKWRALSDQRCRGCFPDPLYHQFNLNQHDMLREVLQRQTRKFDFVFLCNVFHELPPGRWVQLLVLLFEFLTPDGQLVVIDPDVSWCFSRAAWSSASEWHLEEIPVEWETDAVWLSRSAIRKILRSLGFAANVHHYSRSTMELWKATGSRPATTVVPQVAAGVKSLRNQLKLQVASERVRIADLRDELRERFRSSAGAPGELLVKAFEFFAACASQCRRLEALEELRK